jgi:serine protease AprX
LKRRAKTLSPNQLIDMLDLPVSQSKIAQIEQTGAKIRTISRWFNAVSVEATPQQLQMLKALPIINAMDTVAILRRSEPWISPGTPGSMFQKKTSTTALDYGLSEIQLTDMKATDLHNIGVYGEGVLIGMLDDGFNNYRTHAALKNIRVLADSDFIHNIGDVNRQPWENSDQGNHGAGTLSAIGGFDNGHLIGAAYNASFILAKTEMDSVEVHAEEDNYVAALEWMERLGVDITSSSLGYRDFVGQPSYTASQMDGRTTIVARGAVIAARKGVLVVTAMGNEGNYVASTLVSPSDADSIISVGAVQSNGILAAFSGCGPTADGRIKPEVVAQGVNVYWANGSSISSYQYANGTSCSTPLAAGAAALVLSAHPELTNMQVRQALLNTANPIDDGTNRSNVTPNNYFGFGFVRAIDAALSCGPVFSNRPLVIIEDSIYHVSMRIRQKSPLPLTRVRLYYKRPQDINFQQAELQSSINRYEYIANLPFTSIDSTSVGFFTARDQYGVERFAPYDTSGELFSLAPTPDSILNTFPPLSPLSEYRLYQNYPNPFNANTTIIFEVPAPTDAELTVFNLLGQHVKTIYHGWVVSIAASQWDGTNSQGQYVASGVYIVRLKTANAVISKKMLYLK